MKMLKRLLATVVLLSGLGLVLPLFGGTEPFKPDDEDKTLSPYFIVKSDNPEVDKLPLKSTRADVTVSGVIADVQVTQVYKNAGQNTLEAIYVFPASTKAAVYAMKMTIGERTIVANVREKQKAREIYEKALEQGKTASLLEQHRPNVFQMNVGNILPGDVIKVVLNYTEALVPKDNVYEFVYPTVVGPRYSNQLADKAPAIDKWVANPYLQEGEDAPFTFGFALTLNSGIPIAKITSPSHDIGLEYTGKNTARIGLPESNKTGNRDVVIRYTLAGDKIESGLLMNLGKKEDFFLLMLEPPKRVESKMIVPREYVFIIDISGSMHGFPLDVTKALMRDLLGNLRPSDYFNVMLFSGGNRVLSEKSLPANRKNLQKAIDIIARQRGGGGTQLMPALRRAMALERAEENISRNMIIVTDGYVSVEKDAFEYIRNNLNKGNVFAFGIGSSVNRHLIEGMARAGMGEPFIILNQEQAKAKAKQFKKYIEAPVLTNIKVDFQGLKVSDVEPISVPDLFAKKPVVVFGKYHGTPKGKVVITGKTADQDYRQEIRISEGKVSTNNKALRYLWARHRIIRLADMNKLDPDDKRVKEVTQLGLKYNLLTDYTSFVAVDTIKRTEGKPRTTVEQPLPLPQGVSDYAVGRGRAQKTMAKPAAPRIASSGRNKTRMRGMRGIMGSKDMSPILSAPAAELKEMGKRSETRQSRSRFVISVLKGQLRQAVAEKTLQPMKQALKPILRTLTSSGYLSVKFHIDATGKITKVEVVNDSLNNKALIKVIKEQAKKVNFEKPQDGREMVVRMIIKVHMR